MERNEIPGDLERWEESENKALVRADEKWTESERKAIREEAKERRADRMASMSEMAMDVMEMGLQDEDSGIRMKALAMYLDRNVSRVGIDRSGEEVIEVIPVGTKMVVDELEAIIRKQIQAGRTENGTGAV